MIFAELRVLHARELLKNQGGLDGKSKGLLHVLREQGKINSTRIKQYSLAVKTDKFGTVVDYSTSLRHIMGFCHDFVNEEGMLQHIAKRLGTKVLLTSQCHAKLAGEGVEYIWGGAKGRYQRLALLKRGGKTISRPVYIITCQKK